MGSKDGHHTPSVSCLKVPFIAPNPRAVQLVTVDCPHGPSAPYFVFGDFSLFLVSFSLFFLFFFNCFSSISPQSNSNSTWFCLLGFPGGSEGKESACNAGDPSSIPWSWVGKILWRRKWQPTPVFLPGESHGQRSLVGYSPWAAKSWTRLSD